MNNKTVGGGESVAGRDIRDGSVTDLLQKLSEMPDELAHINSHLEKLLNRVQSVRPRNAVEETEKLVESPAHTLQDRAQHVLNMFHMQINRLRVVAEELDQDL